MGDLGCTVGAYKTSKIIRSSKIPFEGIMHGILSIQAYVVSRSFHREKLLHETSRSMGVVIAMACTTLGLLHRDVI